MPASPVTKRGCAGPPRLARDRSQVSKGGLPETIPFEPELGEEAALSSLTGG